MILHIFESMNAVIYVSLTPLILVRAWRGMLYAPEALTRSPKAEKILT